MNHFRAISAGPELAQLRATRGQVLAVFSNAIYFHSETGHIVGVVGPGAEDGPFTLRVEKFGLLLQLLAESENLTFTCGETFIELHGIARLELGHVRQWRAQPPDAVGEISQRVAAVKVLLGLLGGSWCSRGTCGLAAYLYSAHRSLPLPLEVPPLRSNSTRLRHGWSRNVPPGH